MFQGAQTTDSIEPVLFQWLPVPKHEMSASTTSRAIKMLMTSIVYACSSYGFSAAFSPKLLLWSTTAEAYWQRQRSATLQLKSLSVFVPAPGGIAVASATNRKVTSQSTNQVVEFCKSSILTAGILSAVRMCAPSASLAV